MTSQSTENRSKSAFVRLASRTLGIEPGEFVAVAWSFAYFFCILSSYFMLRSVREAMAIVSGVTNIPWLFTGTFTLMLLVTPVFGWLTSKFPRRVFLPWIYYFFVANILISLPYSPTPKTTRLVRSGSVVPSSSGSACLIYSWCRFFGVSWPISIRASRVAAFSA